MKKTNKTKRGISLIILAITIIIMVILTGVAVLQTGNILVEAEKENFMMELAVIEDKIEEYYLLSGILPVKADQTYTASEIIAKISNNSDRALLENEININKDSDNTLFIADIDRLGVETNERGKAREELDVFAVASNTLNVYYLKGYSYDDTKRFSLATLVDENTVEDGTIIQDNEETLNNQLMVAINPKVWTNELKITVKNTLQNNEVIQYSIGGEAFNTLNNNDKTVVISKANMTENEKLAFATNKKIIINRVINGDIVETKEFDIGNLDISSPKLETLEMLDTSLENYNVIRINSSDDGDSGVKCLYYDYKYELVNGVSSAFCSNRSEVTTSLLLNLGKITNDGIIKLEKSIKTIEVVAVDNAGNVSNITTYTLEDEYLVSK